MLFRHRRFSAAGSREAQALCRPIRLWAQTWSAAAAKLVGTGERRSAPGAQQLCSNVQRDFNRDLYDSVVAEAHIWRFVTRQTVNKQGALC